MNPKPFTVENMNCLFTQRAEAEAGYFPRIVVYGNDGEMIQNQIEAGVCPAMEFANTVDGEQLISPYRLTTIPALTIRLKPLQPSLRIAELLQLHPETIHQRQVQAAHLAIIFAGIEIIQRTPGFKRAAQVRRPAPAAGGSCRACGRSTYWIGTSGRCCQAPCRCLPSCCPA